MNTLDVINKWFAEKCARGALARDTDAYNQVLSALPDLEKRLIPPVIGIHPREDVIPASTPEKTTE